MDSAYVLLFVLNPLTVVLAVLLSRRVAQGELMSDVQAAVDEITAQLGKVRDEVVGEIAKLEEAVGAGDPVDLSGLKAAADALDAIVPDPVVEEPVEGEEEIPFEEEVPVEEEAPVEE